MTTSAELKQQYMTMVQKSMDNEINLLRFQCKIMIAILEKMEMETGSGYVGDGQPQPTVEGIMGEKF